MLYKITLDQSTSLPEEDQQFAVERRDLINRETYMTRKTQLLFFSLLFLRYFFDVIVIFQVVLGWINFFALEMFGEKLYISQLTSLQYKKTISPTSTGLNLMKVAIA